MLNIVAGQIAFLKCYFTHYHITFNMFNGGRPRDSIWQHFTSVMVAGKEYGKCNMCSNQQRAKAYHLKVHYIKCSVVHQLPEAELIPDRPIMRKRKRSPSPPPAKCQAHSMPIVSAQQHMDTHFVKTSTNYKNKIDLEVAKLFYVCNIPFNVAEHSQFKRS